MYQERKPSCAQLAQYVDCFWISRGDTASGQGQALILPDAAMDLIFRYRDGRLFSSLCGTMSIARTVSLTDEDIYLGVRFHPGMAAIAFRMNVASLRDCLVESPFADSYAVLEDQLAISPHTFDIFINWMENHLRQRLSFDDVQRQRAQAMQSVHAVGVSRLAQTMGISRKRFYRDFTQLYGISPRQYSNTYRLLKFQKLTQDSTRLNLCQVALEAGFFDQADMTRQIKKITGKTPLNLMSQSYNTG
ncbi:MAG: AraC family transcriptional regulator [Terasakiella sp.]|uniref:AraC family transcriptional regulator n=1 Tax=unclassified Terasakiella TaxID=2614952 RepID=UPI003B002F22